LLPIYLDRPTIINLGLLPRRLYEISRWRGGRYALCSDRGFSFTKLVSVGFMFYDRRMEFPFIGLARISNVSVGLSRKTALKSP
jgi:hypothetical protein